MSPRVLKRVLIVVAVIVCGIAAVPSLRSRIASVAGGDASQAAQQASDSFPQAARRALAQGRIADAEALAKSRPAGDGEAAAVLARVEALRGNYDGARQLLETAAAAQPWGDAALELGLLLQRQFGRADAAQPHLNRVLSRATQIQDPESLFRAARAAAALGRVQEANSLYRVAARGGDPAVETAWGELFLETYNPREALQSFQKVMKLDESWTPAYVGFARTLANENPPAAAAAAEAALKVYPAFADAKLFLAELDLDNTRYDRARERIDQVLGANASHLDARSLLAAIAYVRGDKAAYDAEVGRVLAINPAFGEVYRVAGDLAARNYRFDEAVALARRATTLDPGTSGRRATSACT